MNTERKISANVLVKVMAGLVVIVLTEMSAWPAIRESSTAKESREEMECAEVVTKDQDLPQEISEYYKKWNFVASFSTEEEQTMVSMHMERVEQGAALTGKAKENKRLQKIYEVMQELREHELPSIDPGFGSPRTRRDGYAARHGIIEVEESKIADGDASVTVVTHGTKREAVELLISQYEESGDNVSRIPSFKEKPWMFEIPANQPRKEIHTWRLVDGKWMKTEMVIWLLETSK